MRIARLLHPVGPGAEQPRGWRFGADPEGGGRGRPWTYGMAGRPGFADCGRNARVGGKGRSPGLGISTSLRRGRTRSLGAGRALALPRPTCADEAPVPGAQLPARTAVWDASLDSCKRRQPRDRSLAPCSESYRFQSQFQAITFTVAPGSAPIFTMPSAAVAAAASPAVIGFE